MSLANNYKEKIVPTLAQEFGFKNLMAVPKFEKVVINVGLKEAMHDEEALKKAQADLAKITGQKPRLCRAKKSIASFKLAKGNPIGLMVTLRGQRMYAFLEKLFNIILPQVKDFRGVSRESFDGHGNYTLGIEEQTVFPEIEYIKQDRPKGLEISIVTSTNDDKIATRLLDLAGMPFKKD